MRKKSLNKLKDKIRAKTKRTKCAQVAPCGSAPLNFESLEQVIASLNPVLRGWFEYFKHAHHPVFKRLDGLVRRRLRAFLRKQEKRPGFGCCLADQMRWTNAFFADAGLFALHTAWQEARCSRWGNRQLESRVRENRTHGSEGGAAKPSLPLSPRRIYRCLERCNCRI